MSGLGQPELQRHTLRLFGELVAVASSWAGKLILGLGEGCSSSGLPAACSLAGAASLLIEPSLADAKTALRDGGIDFLVSTVDEALRTLKNEIRRGRPLGVALVGGAGAAVSELVERGVLPDALFRMSMPAEPDWLTGIWTRVRSFEMQGSGASPSEGLAAYLRERDLDSLTCSLPGRAAVRAFDANLLSILPEEDTVRRRWVQGIARHQRSADQDYRAVWMTEDECDRMRLFLNAQAS